tara:strand:- start:84 stop:689 length:606 start_codon:yes stop_codon:yes gene_type:complete
MEIIITNKMTLVFATTNKNKIKEIQDFIPKSLKILSLHDIGCNYEIEENGKSIAENARIKSSYIKTNYGYDCFADDTGLEVKALGGEPGVYSARYGGKQKSSKKNIDLLLANMKNKIDRTAKFKTCISLITKNENIMFEGIVKGEIIDFPRGKKGFGYDSVFKPDNLNKTFAEISLFEKNKISHRGIAFKKLIKHLITLYI